MRLFRKYEYRIQEVTHDLPSAFKFEKKKYAFSP